MRISSFAKNGNELIPIEVEVTLVPGLPMIQFMGQPDSAIKESAARIKSALHHQGFKFPKAKQVLVNLRPSGLKKTSHGLDLAVAAGILWQSGQLKRPYELPLVYGELTLTGEVIPPEDLSEIADELDAPVLTGSHKQILSFPTLQAKSLQELNEPEFVHGESEPWSPLRPGFSMFTFPREKARLLSLIAAGEHATLFAGPAGTGKSTLARQVCPLLSPPTKKQKVEIKKIWKKQHPAWRPEVIPHHSMTAKSFIGGSSQLRWGEITQAHGGVLILDELLEFPNEAIEALREPCDTGKITLSITGKRAAYPAKFLMLSTTNLCPCGAWLPKDDVECRCSNHRRKLHLQRLSGPFLDRFNILFFTKNEKTFAEQVTSEEILHFAEKARHFAETERGQSQPHADLTFEELKASTSDLILNHLMPQTLSSHRRRLACLRVARTIADLEQSREIRPAHLEEAVSLAVRPFSLLAQG